MYTKSNGAFCEQGEKMGKKITRVTLTYVQRRDYKSFSACQKL